MNTRSSDPHGRSLRKGEMVLDFLRASRRSTYTTVEGRPSTYFTDLDEYCLGHLDGDLFEPATAQKRRQWIEDIIAAEVLGHAVKHSVSRIVFVEKRDAGPIGMLTLMSLLLAKTGLDACVLRPRKRLLIASVKGRPIQPGERMMIVSDVATTGSTVLSAAQRLREVGGAPVAAFVMHDRGEGAREALRVEGIEMLAHIDRVAENEAKADLGIVS